MTRRPLAMLLVGVCGCGVLVAGLLAAAWGALGAPRPAAGATWLEVSRVEGRASFAGAPDQPFFFLALGNDSRTSGDPGLGDAIHVIGVNPAARQATILNIPRDTTGPDGGKINAAHSSGGLPRMVDELDRLLGLRIGYAITTDFPRFVDMVNQIGGIDATLPVALDDKDAGAHFPAGPIHLDGPSALAVARDRKDFVDGDVSRTGNQALLVLSALSTLRAQSPGPAATLRLVATLGRHVTTHDVGLAELFRLGRLALSIDPAAVRSVTIPVGMGPGTNLTLGSGAPGLFRDFADDGILQTH